LTNFVSYVDIVEPGGGESTKKGVLFWYGILIWAPVAAATAAIAATVITLGVSVLGLFTPLMDEPDSGLAWDSVGQSS
jgi:hypothetical protein